MRDLVLGRQMMCVLLKLFSYAVNVKVNRQELIRPDLNSVNIMLGALNLVRERESVCVCVYICVCVCVCGCVCVCVCVCVCMCDLGLSERDRVSECVCVCVCAYLSVCPSVCLSESHCVRTDDDVYRPCGRSLKEDQGSRVRPSQSRSSTSWRSFCWRPASNLQSSTV